MRRSFALAFILLLVLFRAAPAQPIPQDPRLTIGESDNGLRYVVVRHSMPPLRAQVWLTVSAGSLFETDKQRGAANFVSRLATAGSENFPPDSAKPLIQAMGEFNAGASFTETVYRFGLKDASPENVGRALSFLRDVASGLTFPGAELEKERTAILADQKKAANVEQRVQEFLMSQLAPGTVVGERPRTGTPETVNALGVDDLRSFYRRWYVPSNMTIVFVGDMEPPEVVNLIRTTIGAGPKAARPEAPAPGVKALTTSRGAVISDGELTSARIYVLRPTPLQPPVRTTEELRRRVLDSLAVGAFNRRVGAKIQTGKLGFTDAGAFSSDLTGICQLTGVYVVSEPGAWRDAMKALSAEIQRARLHGLFAGEIEETKKIFLSQAEQNVKTDAVRQGMAYAQALSAAVGRGEAMQSAQETLTQLRAIMGTLDEKMVSEHFARLTDPSAVLFMLATPGTGGEAPKDADVLAAGVEAMSVAPTQEAEFIMPTALMAGRPAPAKVVEEKMHEASGVWTAWLDNGVLLHHRKMDASKGQATVTVAVAGGLINETELTRGLTEAGSVSWSRPATSTLPSFAIQELTKDKIQYRVDETDPKKLRLGGGPGVDHLLLAVTGPVEHMETGFQLLHVLLTDPVIEAPGLDQWKKVQLDAADARAKQPKSVFNDGVMNLVYPKSELRPRPLTRGQVEHVTLDAAQEWIRRVIATGPIEVSVVGDISREDALSLAAAYVGSLPKRERISSATFDDKRKIPHLQGEQRLSLEAEGITEAGYIMAGFPGADAENVADARAMLVASQILTTRLTERVQTKEQLVRNVVVQSQTALEFPGFGVFGAFALTDAPKLDPAADAIFAVFDEFRGSGPTVEELATTKQQLAIQMEAELANPGYWTGQLSLLEYRGLKLDDVAGAVAPFRNMTPEEVKSAFAKYAVPEKRLRFTLVQKIDPEKLKAIVPPGGPPAPEKK